MKYILISIIILFVSVNIKAQNTTRFDTCQYLQQYAGEWRYTNGTDTIKLYLRLNRDYSTTYNTIYDRLWGWHEYKHGNTIVESDYQMRFFALPYLSESINVSFWSTELRLRTCSDTTTILLGYVKDYLQNRNRHDVQITLNVTKTQMTWHQQHREGLLNYPYTGMTLPANFVLIKQ